jgi:hypothetical protein
MSKALYRIGFAMLCAAFAATVISATTNTFSFGSNLGTLTYTVTSYSLSCVSAFGPVNYTEWDYSGFSYSDPAAGISQPISGDTYYDEGIGGRYVGSGDCPPLSPWR